MRAATVFNYLVEAELIGSAVMAGVMLVRLLLRKPLGSRFVRALWLLVALRLLLPIALPNPLMNALKPTLSLDAGIRPMADQVRTRVGDAATALYRKATLDHGSPTTLEALRRVSRAAGNGQLSWLMLVIYVSGALGMAGGIIAENLRFSRHVTDQHPSDEVLALWTKICAEQGVKKVPSLVLSEGLPAACAFGCFKPCVAVPEDASGDALEAMLRHACAHVRLRTGWSALLRGFCLCAHWFNPLMWLGAHFSRMDDALACDELAVTGMTEPDRKRYASWLIHQQDTTWAKPSVWVAASCVSMNALALGRRIRLVLHPGTIRPVVLTPVCLLAALVLSIMFATAEQSSIEYIPTLTSPPLIFAGDDLTTSEGAEAYARRFASLEGVSAGVASEYALVLRTEEGWHVSLYMPSGESCEVAFDLRGTLIYYEDTGVHTADMRPMAAPITADTDEGRAWCAFLTSFLEKHVPAIYQAFEAMEIDHSGRIDGEEYLSIRLLDGRGEPLCMVDIQAAPGGRIYRFMQAQKPPES